MNIVNGLRGFIRGFSHGYRSGKEDRIAREFLDKALNEVLSESRAARQREQLRQLIQWTKFLVIFAFGVAVALFAIYLAIAFIKWCWVHSSW
jgi:hypothetical protein